jgi:hypothetical protein
MDVLKALVVRRVALVQDKLLGSVHLENWHMQPRFGLRERKSSEVEAARIGGVSEKGPNSFRL